MLFRQTYTTTGRESEEEVTRNDIQYDYAMNRLVQLVQVLVLGMMRFFITPPPKVTPPPKENLTPPPPEHRNTGPPAQEYKTPDKTEEMPTFIIEIRDNQDNVMAAIPFYGATEKANEYAKNTKQTCEDAIRHTMIATIRRIT